jgi:hypothetical protein
MKWGNCRISHTGEVKYPEASFLNGFLRLRAELAPTQRWHLAELAPMRELAPTLVLKNFPQRPILNFAPRGEVVPQG